jgi:hypothetical protein
MSALHLDWATYEAALYACEHWHYSGCMPAGRTIKLGVWEDQTFKGVVIFSRGATVSIGKPYDLKQTEVCELTRVALQKHDTAVSRIVAVALRLLKQNSPGLRLIVSYAAGEQGHHGGIYQAGGWIYEGPAESYSFKVHGKLMHARTLSSRYGRADIEWLRQNVDPKTERVTGLVRHKYLMPLDAAMREQVLPLAKTYPKRNGEKS